MQPSLQTYQQQANAVYDPQQAAEQSALTATQNATIATDEAQKGQIQTDYQTAIQNLTNTTNENVGQINQLYTNRLGGNFSGLQGNDLGNMFAKATQTQGTIESTRANKLNDIATNETNATNQYNAAYNGLASKYQGLKADYANTNYAAAVKQQQANALAQEKLNISASRASSSAANSAAAGYNMKSSATGLSFTGKNGVPVTAAQFAQATGNSLISILSASHNATDQALVKQIAANGGNITPAMQAKYSYIFGGV